MKNKILKILFIAVLFTGSFPGAMQAQVPKAEVVKETTFSASSYELISPIGNLTTVKDQSENSFSDFVNLLIQIALALAGAICVVIIMVNGVQYMATASSGQKTENKLKISSAIGGLVLLFCSYFLLYTINPDLVKIKIGGTRITDSEWEKAPALKNDGTYAAPPKSSGAKGCAGSKINGQPIVKDMIWPVAEQTKFIEEIKIKNIVTTSSGGNFCTKVGEQRCTAMYFNPTTSTLVKDRLIKLQQKTGQTIKVTGGSECWLHSTHGPDDPMIDLQVTSALNKAITGTDSFPSGKWIEVPGIGTFLAEGVGGSARNTGKHWHAVLK